jgi:hypothetical protein
VLAGLFVLLVIGSIASSGEEDAAAPATTTTEGSSTTAVEETTTTVVEETTTTEPTTTTQAPTTTTEATTTTTTVPTIGSGTYIVPDEVAPETYRVSSYVARLDDELEIIANILIHDGFGVVKVEPTDSYLEVQGEIALVSETGPFDPILLGVTDGIYLVNYDLDPGRYRVKAVDGTAYWARLDEDQEIIDNDLTDGDSIVIVADSDWALEFTGTLEPLPE